MPWKLYIDSRRRVKGSRGDSDTDFAVQLPYPITVSGKAFIDVVLIPNSFKTIRAGQNDKIYLDETAALTKRVATLPPGQYSVFELKDALVAALGVGRDKMDAALKSLNVDEYVDLNVIEKRKVELTGEGLGYLANGSAEV